jgi:HSP20 family protein
LASALHRRHASTPTTEEALANLIVRNQATGQQPLVRPHTWDPMAWARELLRWDPFREMLPTPAAPFELTFAPAFEVKETKEGYTFKADVPGVAEKDLDITCTGNRLAISGQRAFTLPDGVDGDHIQADLRDGVLTIVAPKLPESQPRKVAIKGAEKKS